MPSIETYRKQAKQLVRWHRERNYSIGEKLRLIERLKRASIVGRSSRLPRVTSHGPPQ